MSLTTTPCSNSADSYPSLTYADAYFAKRYPSSAWDAKTDEQKELILRNATIDIDRYFRSCGCNPLLERETRQALIWPWQGCGYEFYLSVDEGSATTATFDWLEDGYFASSYFIGGSLLVFDADDEAPEFELTDISAFDRSTGQITFTALTAALGSSDSVYVMVPVPEWLKQATCEQAYFSIEDKHTDAGNDFQSGVKSKGYKDSRKEYRNSVDGEWLSRATYKLIRPYIPKECGLERG